MLRILTTFLFSKIQIITKMFLLICLHIYGTRRPVALGHTSSKQTSVCSATIRLVSLSNLNCLLISEIRLAEVSLHYDIGSWSEAELWIMLEIAMYVETASSILLTWVLPLTNDIIHLLILSDNPMASVLGIKIAWLTISNALDKSLNKKRSYELISNSKGDMVQTARAQVVLAEDLKANWSCRIIRRNADLMLSSPLANGLYRLV